MGEVGGPVQRVHVPAKLALQPLARALFAVDSMLRKGLGQPLANQLFRCPVGHRHQVHVALVLGLHALRKKLAQPRASLAGNRRGLGNPDKLRLQPLRSKGRLAGIRAIPIRRARSLQAADRASARLQ